MPSLKVLVLLFTLVISLANHEKFVVFLIFDTAEYSEIEDVIFDLNINEKQSGEKKRMEEMSDFNFTIELKKKGKIKKYKLRSFDFCQSRVKRDDVRINRMRDEEINLEMLLGKLNTGSYQLRLVINRGKSLGSIFKINSGLSNWIDFKIVPINDCTQELVDSFSMKKIDDRIEIYTEPRQNPTRGNALMLLKSSIKNISRDTLVFITRSWSYEQSYNLLNEKCEWKNRGYTSGGCSTGNKQIKQYIYPDSTFELNRMIQSGQGVFQLKNNLYNSKNLKDTIKILTSPIIVEGYIKQDARSKYTVYDF